MYLDCLSKVWDNGLYFYQSTKSLDLTFDTTIGRYVYEFRDKYGGHKFPSTGMDHPDQGMSGPTSWHKR